MDLTDLAIGLVVMHVQVKFADLKFTVFARSKQANIHTHNAMKSR